MLGEGCVQEVSCPLTPSLPFWDFLIRRARSLSLAASLSLSRTFEINKSCIKTSNGSYSAEKLPTNHNTTNSHKPKPT